MMKNYEKKIEILAPAGNMKALHAAVCAGANAVYLGLDHFNARRGADNFNINNLSEVCDYAHLRSVKIYLTLNIIIFEEEFDKAIKMAIDAYNSGVDAFIVQDIGLARCIKKFIPKSNLHISTQMNICDEIGLRAVSSLGAKRITLARECSLPEINNLSKIAKKLGVELEVFGHGALCVSYSGQCLMSSMIGGRSANRGMCAQACRLNYDLCGGNWDLTKSKEKLDDKMGSYLLSTKDLCTIDILPQIIKAGANSLKIEGRMKSADYVYSVVSAYKSAVERLYNEGSDTYSPLDNEKEKLAEVFSRGFTTAYLEGFRDNQIMSYNRPNNRGVLIGRVTNILPNKLVIKCQHSPVFDDIVEVWTKRGKASFKIDKNSKINTNELEIKSDMSFGANKYIRKNDRVFRIKSAALNFVMKDNCPKVNVDFEIDLRLQDHAKITCITNVFGNSFIVEEHGNIVEHARTKSINEDEVLAHIDRLGNTDFCLGKININLDEGVGMSYSALHHLRNKALDKLKDKICDSFRPTDSLSKVKITYNHNKNNEHLNPQICAFCTNPDSARICKKTGADAIYVPVLNYKRGSASYAGESNENISTTGYPSDTILAFPTISHDKTGYSLEKKWNLDILPKDVKVENKSFFCDNLSSVFSVLSKGGIVEIGPHLPIVNSQSILYFEDIGAKTMWLSPELSLKQIKDITYKFSQIDFGMFIIGPTELMITEHCHLMSMGNCEQNCNECARRKTKHFLKDRLGYEFPVVTDILGRSHIYNSVSLDLCNALPDLIDAGVTRFMVDTTLMNTEESAQNVGRALKALEFVNKSKAIEKPKKTTTAHLFRGVL